MRSAQLDSAPARIVRQAALLAQAGFPDDAERLAGELDASAPALNERIGRHRVAGEILLARKQPRRAWEEFRKAAALEGAGVLPEYLPRGALAVGEARQARSLYERMAASPGYYWRYPDREYPGTWFDARRAYIELTQRMGPAVDVTVQPVLAVSPVTGTRASMEGDPNESRITGRREESRR